MATLTQSDAFLRDICDNPEDVSLRLIYADWLADPDESGEACDPARGASLREQVGVRQRIRNLKAELDGQSRLLMLHRITQNQYAIFKTCGEFGLKELAEKDAQMEVLLIANLCPVQ